MTGMTKILAASALGLAAVAGFVTPSEAGARLNFYVGPAGVPGYYAPYPYEEPIFIPRRPRYYYYEPDPRELYAYDDEFDGEPYDDRDYDPRYERRANRFEQYDYDRQFLAPELQEPRVEERVQPRKPVKKAEQKKPEKKKAATLSCTKATKVVSEYGFSDITSLDCKGQVYAFNGVRDGKKFSIKLNSVNGELTEVKKL